MSDPSDRQPDQMRPDLLPPAQNSGCGTVILGFVGFLLLLPGVCVIILGLIAVSSGPGGIGSARDWMDMAPFLFVIFALFAAGILMIRQAFK